MYFLIQYRQHIITDPNIYLNSNKNGFRIGTTKQAEEQGWISWSKLRNEFESEDKMVEYIANLTMITPA